MANRRPPASLARKAGSLARQAWPLWLALLIATGVFTLLCRPVAARRRLLHQATTVLPDSLWVERAVAAAAVDHQANPGSSIPQEHWLPFLPNNAPPSLRTHGHDAFGHPFGPQSADRPVTPPAATQVILEALARKETAGRRR